MIPKASNSADRDLAPDVQAALAIALRKLGSRDRFEAEIRAVLSDAGTASGAIDRAVEWLTARGILDDARVVAAFVDRSLGKRTRGSDALREELAARGAAPSAIDEALLRTDASEADRAVEALRAKFPAGTDRVRAGRFLAGRGFGEDDVEAALDRFLPRASS